MRNIPPVATCRGAKPPSTLPSPSFGKLISLTCETINPCNRIAGVLSGKITPERDHNRPEMRISGRALFSPFKKFK